MSQDHEFHLLDNALDYVLSAAEHAAKNTPRDLKYAVLHLVAGVELLLKARLQSEHWSLLFANVDAASQERLASGDFKSVDFDTAVSRLEGVAHVAITKQDVKVLDGLRRLRNQVQHFGARMNRSSVQSQIGYVANFVVEFVKAHLPGLQESHGVQLKRIREVLLACRSFVDERMATLQEALGRSVMVTDCPYCMQDAVPIGDDIPPSCRFCDEEVDPSVLASIHSESGELFECPSCGQEACAVTCSADDCGYQCFACGDDFDAGEVGPCCVCEHRLVSRTLAICQDCMSTRLSKGD